MPRLSRPVLAPFRDVFAEGVAGLAEKRARPWLTVAGIAVGVASLVAVVGLTQTSTERLLGQLDTLTPTLITATPVGRGEADPPTLTWRVERQLGRLDGLVGVGALGAVPERRVEVAGPPVLDPTRPASQQFEAIVATSGVVDVLGGTVAEGRFFDPLHDVEPYPVVVVGPGAARSLRLPPVDGYISLLIDQTPHVVLGVLFDHQATGALTGAILFPAGRAEELGVPGPDSVYVRVRPGATERVADQLPRALHPNSPSDVAAFVSLLSPEVGDIVEAETSALFVLLSVIAIALATLTVSVVMLMTVLERRTEIGLRRAIGATRLRIAGEFLVHSAWLGSVGGAAGTALGLLITAGVATLSETPPVIDPRIVLAGPAIGIAAGLFAGVYPAIRAARIEPAQALRAI